MSTTSETETPATMQPATVPQTQLDERPQNPPLAVSTILGVVDALSEAEQAKLTGCEAVIATGWQTFVEVGVALAEIRNDELYRAEFNSFEAYCQVKWQYGRRYVDQLISAAELFTHLRAICSQQKPAHEGQLRPLVGLTLEQAQRAWEHAARKAGQRKLTARMVQSSVHELHLAGPKPASYVRLPSKADQRQMIGEAVGQLLLLVGQKASYETLTAKIEALHQQIQSLFAAKSSRLTGRPQRLKPNHDAA